MKHVLLPHDGDEPADAALSFACEGFPDASITVLHVVEPFPDHTAAGADDVSSDWRERAEAYANGIFESARSIAAEFDTTVETEWVYGRPRRQILEYADDHGVDQIVMGSHGRGAVGRLVFGSVAETVVRRSPIPVTIVRQRWGPDANDASDGARGTN